MELAVKEKTALIIGRGEQVKIRAKQLVNEQAKVVILSNSPTIGAIRSTGLPRNVSIRPEGLDNWEQVLRDVCPFLVIVSTMSVELDEKIAQAARIVSKLVYVVDRPHLNDLNMTGVARLGDIRVAVSTKGLSPALAGVLRRKIESLIVPEEILQVKLQGEIRSALKKTISDPARRKKAVYKLIRDKRISSLLQSSKYEDAKLRALYLIAKSLG